MATPLTSLKRRVLQQRGVELQKHTTKPAPIEEVPDICYKTHFQALHRDEVQGEAGAGHICRLTG